MSILLTGGTGYIGSHKAVVLTELGCKVVLFVNLSNSNETVLERLAQVATGSRSALQNRCSPSKMILTACARGRLAPAVAKLAGLCG